MTLEEYKKKYPNYTVSSNHCWTVTDVNKDIAKALNLYQPMQTTVWLMDLDEETVRFGNFDLTNEQIEDTLSLKETLIKEHQQTIKEYEESEEEKERIERFQANIKWRKQKINELKREIDNFKYWIQCDEKELKELTERKEDDN